MPWVRFFPSDWLGGTRGMSASETGIYITLIATMYERGEPVPEDHPRLARLCGSSNSAFRAALEVLIAEGKILRLEDGLWNDRVEKESVYRSEKSEVGRQAAVARWGKKNSKNNSTPHANAMQSQCDGNANQKPEPEKKSVGAEAPTSPEPEKSAPVASSPTVIDLPCVSGDPFPISEADVTEWRKAFPAVDVPQQLRAMRSWLDANPTRRKTRKGMKRFVVSWLDRRQNEGGSKIGSVPRSGAPPPPRVTHGVTAALARRYQRQDQDEQIPEVGSSDQDAQCVPADERRLQLVAGHIRAAVGGGFN